MNSGFISERAFDQTFFEKVSILRSLTHHHFQQKVDESETSNVSSVKCSINMFLEVSLKNLSIQSKNRFECRAQLILHGVVVI